ncbi:MAG: lipopolysaccharide transport periplasmic protein LptA [Candidatus Rokubacteria bacterium]|nr:lipopolysaccharide transport periplasmic protein LptA [Candidatus Rokubacteria bacterium]
MRRVIAAIGLVALLATPGAAAPPSGAAAQTPPRGGGPAAKDEDGKTQPVTVDADRMERYGREGLVVFTGNVVARQGNSVQYAERMEVYFDEKGDRILRTVSTGSVRIVTRDCRTGTAKRAEYFDLEQRLVLSGGARVWQDDNVVSGETITIFLAQDRSVVQGGKQDRVKAVFHPRDDKAGDGTTKRPAKTAAPCDN